MLPKAGAKKELLAMAVRNAKQNLLQKGADQQFFAESLFQQLKTHLNLPQIPQWLEVYDNSHLFGQAALGAYIVVNHDGFCKAAYRSFNFKEASGDDLKMMEEMLKRRLKRLDEGEYMPDLLLIDGGKTQAAITAKVLAELKLKIPFLAIAKGKERNHGKERFFVKNGQEIIIEDQSLRYFLQRIRDEAHRFAITKHRLKRQQKITQSELDQIPGLGPKRKQILLNHFGSLAQIKGLSINDLTKAPQISQHLAKTIYQYLHGSHQA